MDADTFQDLAWRAEYPAPAFHVELFKAQTQLLRERPDGVAHHAVGSIAWASLDDDQRAEAFRLMLDHYTTMILLDAAEQEHEEQLAQDLANPAKSYVTIGDVGALWDAVHDSPATNEYIDVERQSLVNVLAELELLQHRVAMLKSAAKSA